MYILEIDMFEPVIMVRNL